MINELSDNFKGQLTDDFLQMLEVNTTQIAYNLKVYKSTKDFLTSKFKQWYSDQIFD